MIHNLCHQIEIFLFILEEGTLWGNQSKLYIGLIKEEIRKDMKESYWSLFYGTTVQNIGQAYIFLLLVAYFSITEETHISLSQARKAIYPTFANSNGKNVAIIENKVHTFYLIKKSLIESSGHQEESEMICPNGS